MNETSDLTSRLATRKVLVTAALVVGAVALLAFVFGYFGKAKAAEGPKWSGIYAGASIGHAATTTTADIGLTGLGTLGSIDGLGTSGHSLGLVIGADMQFDRFVVGVFGDYTWHDQTWSVSVPLLVPGPIASLDVERQWTIGGRAGITVGNSLIYGLVGYTTLETSDISVPPAALSLAVPDLKGWTLGGGIDVSLGSGLFLGAEYRYTSFDNVNVALVPGLASLGLDTELQEVKARLTYKFGLPGQ